MDELNTYNDIPEFTANDFLNDTAPYEFIYQFEDNKFVKTRVLEKVAAIAKAQKINGFKGLYAAYVEMARKQQNTVYAPNVTSFEGQEFELDCGSWAADEYGIRIDTPMGEMEACCHPIMPVLRLINIDTGLEKIQLKFRKGNHWKSVLVDKKTIASNNSIVSLADFGISVTSENAKYLVRYLYDIENLNYSLIPVKKCIGRLGWIDNVGFSPYVNDLVFDGDANYKTFFESLTPKGKYDKWLELAKDSRTGNVITRIILASSFASVLVKPLGGLVFFVHLWGASEAAKTVGLLFAASVWADPELGRYAHTFNSTIVGNEKSAAFVNSMPLVIDELQIIRDKKDFDKEIYTLSEGAGRTRGNKNGGVDMTPTWRNCILTNGEMPITSISSGGGAVNRIIEIECKERLFREPREAANLIMKNYGFAGRIFVEKLQEEGNLERAEQIFKKHYAKLSENDTTEKQAMSAATILTADELATEWIFEDGNQLEAEDIALYLQTKRAVSVNERAYEYVCEYAVQNANHFAGKSGAIEVWGEFSGSYVYIVAREFNRICNDAGYNPTALRSWLKSTDKLLCDSGRNTKKTRINDKPVNCVAIRIPDDSDDIDISDFEEITI